MSIRLKCFIIDDDVNDREHLRNLLGRAFKDVDLVGESGSLPEAKPLLEIHRPHMVFLDLHIGKNLGFELFANGAKPDFEVVITSGYKEYALEAFRFGVLDYLVKPLGSVEVHRALSRARRAVSPSNASTVITFQTSEGSRVILANQIYRMEADRNYTVVHGIFGASFYISKNLGYFESLLEKNRFFRVHHSHLVSLYHIAQVHKSDGSLETRDGKIIPVSREKKKRLLELLDLIQREEP
jgi:two-component system LytT family response regulator